MTAYYLDTSALVNRYVQEPGTQWIISLADPTMHNDIYTIILTGVEVIAALFRKVRTGEITLHDALRTAQNFRSDWQTHFQIVEVEPLLVENAMNLAEKHGLRGYDAAHLAAALIVQLARQTAGLMPLTFVSADQGQLRAAATEGLLVENPSAYP